jgi:hypothetical protein
MLVVGHDLAGAEIKFCNVAMILLPLVLFHVRVVKRRDAAVGADPIIHQGLTKREKRELA